jgi:hypothetical protein
MRKSLKFTQGRRQFQRKLVTPVEAQKNAKYLHLLVFKCEANWAYAMQMRQIVSGGAAQPKIGDALMQQMVNRNPNRLKVHARKRL